MCLIKKKMYSFYILSGLENCKEVNKGFLPYYMINISCEGQTEQ